MSLSQLLTLLKMNVSVFRGLERYRLGTYGILGSVSFEVDGGTLWELVVELGEVN